jgi:EAL domain-containing protein (putative c-di-GMP-specific phosphodiesterase class I)
VRWTHPTRGPVAPSVFIPYAERSGQIIEIGQWVLERAWRDHKRWQAQQPDLCVAVNVSGHQLMSGGFAATVTALLNATSVDPALLTFEVTETIFLGDHPHALTVLDELKRLGVNLAIDDFGTGYSSLSHLTGLPFDSVKIEQNFTAELATGPCRPCRRDRRRRACSYARDDGDRRRSRDRRAASPALEPGMRLLPGRLFRQANGDRSL